MNGKDQPDLTEWTPQSKRALVLELLCEKDTLAGFAHDHHLPITTLYAWREAFLIQERLGSIHRAAS